MTAPGGRREKDRWHQLADAIGASNLPASDKSVFRALLDRADYGTAVMQHRFTETQATIARKTSHSIRQVKYAVRHLELHGWLTVKGKTGPGRTLDYSLTIGASCDCTGRVHTAAARERVQPAPATGATSTPRTVATRKFPSPRRISVSLPPQDQIMKAGQVNARKKCGELWFL